MLNRSPRNLVLLSILTLGMATYGTARAQSEGQPPVYTALSPAVVKTLSALPIQAGGRVKPFDTVARFTLLRMSGKRSMRLGSGKTATRISASEWMAQVLLFPERVTGLPLFVVDNAEVIVAIGVTDHDKKRSRYSYNELFAGLDKLFALAREYSGLEFNLRSARQNSILNLAQNVSDFEQFLHALDFTRERFTLTADLLPSVVEAPLDLNISDFIRAFPLVQENLQDKLVGEGEPAPPELKAVTELMDKVNRYAMQRGPLHTLPPADHSVAEWLSAQTVLGEFVHSGRLSDSAKEHLAAWVSLTEAKGNDETLLQAVESLTQTVRATAQARGEIKHIDKEVHLYKTNYFFRGLFWYIIAFLTVAASWLVKPNPNASRPSQILRTSITLTPLLIATLHLFIGITLRCIIRGRPPVTNLYETVLFITLSAVLVSFVTEWLTRDRIAISMASILGVGGMFLANKYEMKEAVDTMPSLVAVLDTNFWLSTHVTCITIGYAAGLLAGALGHLFILGKLVGLKKRDASFYTSLSSMTYGVLCFGLLFAFVGTMLGGVWANYSWGRFWGWDPKENGALLIVLWHLIVIHARLGGFIRDFGLAACAIFGAAIVAFSWWGVNLLGVGLHTYGFTSGIARALTIYWSIEAVILLAGFMWRWRQNKRAQ